MDSIKSRFVPYEMQTTIVKVISYEGRNIQGYLSNPFFKEDVYFDSLIPLLQLMEDMLDSLHFPQRSMERRIFETNASHVETTTARELSQEKPIATFKLRVLFRQNASWQGDVVWMEQRTAAQFRSVLELVGILDSALGAA